MKASEARKIAIEANNSVETEEYNELIEYIIECSKKGEVSAYYYDRIGYKVIDRLKDDGYVFSNEVDNQRDDYSIKISW